MCVRASMRVCKRACVRHWGIVDPWSNSGWETLEPAESHVQRHRAGWSWDLVLAPPLLASSPPESTSQRPGEHQVSYACSMLCQGRKTYQPVKVVTLFPGKQGAPPPYTNRKLEKQEGGTL